MLEEMRIRGLGVIDDAVLEFAPGLTVVSGETGAGKTMVVTGLGLLCGGRADPGLVRPGARNAVIEGRIVLPADHPAVTRATDAGAELDDDALIVTRTIAAEGRSRTHLGGRSVPAGVLADIASDLVAVHGQSDQQRLLHPSRQRAALDRYAGDAAAKPLAVYTDAYRRLRAVDAELDELTTRARERAQEADLLRHGLAEIEAVAPTPGEDTDLAAERARLEHADQLRAAAAGAHDALAGDPDALADPGVLDRLAAARRALDAVSDHDTALARLAERIAEAGYLLADAATELASYASSVDADPARLAAVQERTAALTGLRRKYGDTVADILAWAEQAATRLADLDNDDDHRERLTAERAALRETLTTAAATLSAARAAAADAFAAEVTAELAALAMPHARISVALHRTEDPDGLPVGTPSDPSGTVAFGPTGVDDVELLLAPHPGAPARPLARGASGGELSRVMLAVEVVFAGSDPVPTFVFDEVDAGVGGKAAVEVGRRLARLARTAQVIVVTHLPQVAAFADRHLLVEKSLDGHVTRSGVTVLDDAARLRELARMLAGLEDSALGRAHAEELLATAASAKSTDAPPQPARTRLTTGRP